MPPKNSCICNGGNCLIAYLCVLVSPRLCRISAKKACLSFLIVQLQHPSSIPLISSACNACSFLVYIYVLHTNWTAYATFYHSEHCLWIKLVHSMLLIEFTTNLTTTDCTRVFPKVTLQNLILWEKNLHLSVVYLQASSLHCSFTRVKTLNHFFHRHWRLRQYLSYTCSCNWYMNGKFFTTEWKQEIKFSFRKMSKLNFDLYFDLCRSVEFTLVSSISILH